MSMSRPRRATFLAVLSPASLSAAVLAGVVFASACVQRGAGPSDVASGKEYVSGNASYDAFFDHLYQAQVTMGQAQDRHDAIVKRLAATSGADATATSDEVVLAVKRRAESLAKSGVAPNLTVTGLDGDQKPATTFSHTGTPAGSDSDFLEVLESASSDLATLLASVRDAMHSIDGLGTDAPGLEHGVDAAFDAGKRPAVSQNLGDAERILPLMHDRGKDVSVATADLLTKLQNAVNVAPALAPKAPEPAAPAKKKGHKPKSDNGASAGNAGSSDAKPAEATPAPPPKPAAKKPADDFEP